MALLRLFAKNKTSQPTNNGKTRSAEDDDSKAMCGVFVSSRTLSTTDLSSPNSSSSNDSFEDSASLTTSTSAATWKNAGLEEHHRGSPLFVPNPDESGNPQTIANPSEILDKIMARSKDLPDTWYYSSNHVLVNQERSGRTMAPLIRMRGLDEIARIHAQQMADEGKVHQVNLHSLRIALNEVKYSRLGVNVQKGQNIRSIHYTMMNTLPNKNNILDRRFTHMGMGTAVGTDGSLYLCQIFRG